MKYFKDRFQLLKITSDESEFKAKLRDELLDLDEKLDELNDICWNKRSDNLMNVTEAIMLDDQFKAMRAYGSALIRRCVHYGIVGDLDTSNCCKGGIR